MNDDARKIGALLAKAERTDNPHEAEAYTRKAEALMIKLGIGEAMARQAAGADVRPEAIIERRVDLWVNPFAATGWFPSNPTDTFACVRCERDLPVRKYPTTKNRGERGRECRECRDGRYVTRAAVGRESNAYNREHVVGFRTVALALGVDTYYVGEYHAIYFVGFASDVERVAMLAVSLKAQVMLALWTWWQGHPFEREVSWRSAEAIQARRDFVVAFYGAVGRRLREQSQTAVDATPGAALALRDKAADLRDHMESMNLKAGKPGRSYGGSAAGAEAGRNASLGGRSVGGGHRAIGRA